MSELKPAYETHPYRWRSGAPPDIIVHDGALYVHRSPDILTTELAECLKLDRHELAAAIAVVQCRAMQARTHEALAGMVEG